ncbi:MAG: hypothetical protein LBD90_07785 [Bifidobacteriaceae bacterium]|jgi:hypothetical protein|nr:hypothetical protein [Bifidobacteriaceae bacterium]
MSATVNAAAPARVGGPAAALPDAVAPRFPLAAARSRLVRQWAIWLVLAARLAETVGFGVMSATEAAETRAALLPENLASFAVGAMPFYGAAMALVIGVLVVGGEYQKGAARLVYTQGPSRPAVLGAQLTALEVSSAG